MASSESSTSPTPHRRGPLFTQRRPITSYISDAYHDFGSVSMKSDSSVGCEGLRRKERPTTGRSSGQDQIEGPTCFQTTTKNPAQDKGEVSCLHTSSTVHLAFLREGLQSLQSFGRKMSVSLRPRGANCKGNAFSTSYEETPTTSSIRPSSSRRTFSQHKPKTSRWIPRSSFPKQQPLPPMPTQCSYLHLDPPPYKFGSPPPATWRGPPPLPFDMHTGAAARAAAAAQNEALHYYQRQSLGTRAEMPRVSDLKLSQDSESGIGIEMPDQRDYAATRAPIIRQDPAQVLPAEMMEQTLCYLDAETLVRAERVCRNWRGQACSQHVWRYVFEREYQPAGARGPGSRNYQPRGVGKKMANQDWKRMYLLRRRIDRRWAEAKAAAIYLSGHKDSVYCVHFDEHKIVTGSRDRTIRVWDTHSYQCIRRIGPPGYVPRAAPVPDVSTLDPNGAFYIQNTPCVDPVEGSTPNDDYHDASILCLQFDEEILVTGSSDQTAIVWSIRENYRLLRRLRGHTAGVLDVCLNEDYIVTCSKDTTICLWDRRSCELIKRLSGHRGPVNAVQLRGNLLASASGDGTAKLWNVRDGRCVKEFTSKDRGLACLEFSEDGRSLLAGGNDHVIYEYDTNTGDLVHNRVGHKGLVRSLHLDSGNKRLVSGSYDMSLKVWEDSAGSGASDMPPKINFAGLTSSWMLAVKSDYRKIVCTSQDGRVVIMDFGYGLDGVEMLESS